MAKRRAKYIQYPNQDQVITSLPMVGQALTAENVEETLDQMFFGASFVNNMVSSLGFNTGDGILTITMNDTPNTTITAGLDGRYSLLAHTHVAANITDFSEAVDDRVDALIQDGTGLAWTYNDGANTLTGNVSLTPFSTTNLSEGTNLYFTDERVDDRVAALINNSATVTWTYNDPANTLIATAIGVVDGGSGEIVLGNFTFDADQVVGAGQDDYVLRYDHSSGLISLEALAGTSVNFGTDNQIPIMNAGGTDFEYDAGFTYDNNRLRADGTGSNSVAIGPSAVASGNLSIAIGNIAEAEATNGAIAIGANTGNTTGTKGDYSISVGGVVNTGSSNIGSYSLALGYEADVTHTGGMSFGRTTIAGAQGAIIMGYHTSAQTNAVSDSFKLMWDGNTGFHVGLTVGTQITNNADPATNLTDVANGVLAYDTTDHQLQAYINSAWYKVSTLTNLIDSGANVIESSTGTGYFEWDQVRLNGQTLSIYQSSGSGTHFTINQVSSSLTNISVPLDLTLQVGPPVSTTSDFIINMSNSSALEEKLHITYNTTTIRNDSIVLADTPPNASAINQILVRNSSSGAIEYASITDLQNTSDTFINNGGNTSAEYRTYIKIIEIGEWNMDSTPSVIIPHELSPYGIDRIRSVTVEIIEDATTLHAFDFGYQGGGDISWTEDNIILERTDDGAFDSVNFNSITSPANRGFITIICEWTTSAFPFS